MHEKDEICIVMHIAIDVGSEVGVAYNKSWFLAVLVCRELHSMIK